MTTKGTPSKPVRSTLGESGQSGQQISGEAALSPQHSEQQANDRAQSELDRRKQDHYSPELLSIISHELRSPLAAIKGYAATLRRHDRRLSREERKEFLDAIDEASDRLTRIVERILELSQLEMGLATMAREPVALSRLVREAQAAAERRLAASRGDAQHFTFQFIEQNVEGALVLADVRYLRDVLDNLLENAIAYSPNGGVIAIRLVPHHGLAQVGTIRPALELTISDEGIGIPEEHLTRIFDTFQRVDLRSTRETGGIGLGLAICREIVEQHGGLLWAENQPNGGSVFHVVLPLVDEKEVTEREAAVDDARG